MSYYEKNGVKNENYFLNKENLIALWQEASSSYRGNVINNDFSYSQIVNSDWPNRLWFNRKLSVGLLHKVKDVSNGNSFIYPYWEDDGEDSSLFFEKEGFTLKFTQIGMSLKVSSLFSEDKEFELRLVQSSKEAQIWSKLFKGSFGYEINSDVVHQTVHSICYYIAYSKGDAVGTALVYKTEGAYGVHSVGVTPLYRRKGVAEKIMKILLNRAYKKEESLVTLQASEMGKGLYLKLGFKEDFVIRNYILTT